MSDQYTPSTEEVLAHWDRSHTEVGAAALRRWLATVKAEAWDEAVEVLDQLHGDLPGLDHIVQDLGDINPYREQETP